MNVVNFGSLNLDHVYAVDHFCRAGETIHTKSYTQKCKIKKACEKTGSFTRPFGY